MSLNLLKRELENDLEEFEAKKAKQSIKGNKFDKPASKKPNNKKPSKKFVFNDWDYTIEEDYTEDCLKNIGVLDKKIDSVKTDKIIAHNQKTKRQEDFLSLDTGAKNEESIFTDADFEVISQLNFVNSSQAFIVDEFTGDREYKDVIKDGKKKRVKRKKKKNVD